MGITSVSYGLLYQCDIHCGRYPLQGPWSSVRHLPVAGMRNAELVPRHASMSTLRLPACPAWASASLSSPQAKTES